MAVTLSYFEARGLAEPIRWILAYGGEKFEDIRAPLTMPPVIPPEIKSKCTWGQVPVVELGDGKKLTQSLAITRYFAKKHQLVPKDDFQAALCDEYVDASRDFMNQWVPTFGEKDETKQKEKQQDVLKAVKPRFLDVFNSIIEGNGGKFLVGDTLTWADIYVAYAVSNIEIVTGISLFADFPALKAHGEMVLAKPGIKEWVEKRPVTKF